MGEVPERSPPQGTCREREAGLSKKYVVLQKRTIQRINRRMNFLSSEAFMATLYYISIDTGAVNKMNAMQYATFVHDHRDEIVDRIRELDNFSDADISMLKSQIVQGINIRKHMPVIPMNEIRQLLVGYIAIRFIEDELGIEF